MNGHARHRLDQIRADVDLTETYNALLAEVPREQQQDHFNKVVLALLLEHEESHRTNRLGFRSLTNVVGALIVGMLATLDRVLR